MKTLILEEALLLAHFWEGREGKRREGKEGKRRKGREGKRSFKLSSASVLLIQDIRTVKFGDGVEPCKQVSFFLSFFVSFFLSFLVLWMGRFSEIV